VIAGGGGKWRAGHLPLTVCPTPAVSHCPDPPPIRAPRSQEIHMAVQQNKKSPSKRGMHRSHNAIAAPGTAIEPTTGEVHLRHHISPTGFYRGRKVLKTKADA
jgi:large subunit ribosomal protein L32